METKNRIRIVLLVVYGIIAVLFLYSSGRIFLNHYLVFSPDKISAEFETTLYFTLILLSGSLFFSILFFLLLKERKEIVIVFPIIFIAILLFLDSSGIKLNIIKEASFIIFFLVLPILNWVYLFDRYMKIKLFEK